MLKRLNHAFFLAEQLSFNYMVRVEGLKTAFLPARVNWMCNRTLPMFDSAANLFVEPQPPHDPIGIMHLTANTKDKQWPIADLAGGVNTMSLTFPPQP